MRKKITRKKLDKLIEEELEAVLQEQGKGSEYVIGSSLDPADRELLKQLRADAKAMKARSWTRKELELLARHGDIPQDFLDDPVKIDPKDKAKRRIRQKARRAAAKASGNFIDHSDNPLLNKKTGPVDPDLQNSPYRRAGDGKIVGPDRRVSAPPPTKSGAKKVANFLEKLVKKIPGLKTILVGSVLFNAERAYAAGGFPKMFEYLKEEVPNYIPIYAEVATAYKLTEEAIGEILKALDKDHYTGIKNTLKPDASLDMDRVTSTPGVDGDSDFMKRLGSSLRGK